MHNYKNASFDISDCVTNHTKPPIYYVRENLLRYMGEHDLSAYEFSKLADVSVHTIHSVLYSKTLEDCKLSTASRIASVMGITLDELANTGLFPDKSLESVRICRKLPDYIVERIRRYIRWQEAEYNRSDKKEKLVDVMNLDYVNDHLLSTNDIEIITISEFSDDIKSKVFRGMRIPCEDYAKYYDEGDILLLASERPPKFRERVMIQYYGRIFIVQKDIKDGVHGYRGIRNLDSFIPESDIDYYFGYVAAVKHVK